MANMKFNSINNFLVLIAEEMEESLILLQELTCWSLQDITYLNQNQRKSNERNKMTPKTRFLWEFIQFLLFLPLINDDFRFIFKMNTNSLQIYSQTMAVGWLYAIWTFPKDITKKTCRLWRRRYATKSKIAEGKNIILALIKNYLDKITSLI